MYYFAYGSNMNFQQMRRVCGWHFQVLGVAELSDFEFGADLRGYNNIRPKKASKVYGVLYDVDQECLDALDEFEGYPNVFMRAQLEVKDTEGKRYSAAVFLKKPEDFAGAPFKEGHIRQILAGAKQNHLPGKWIEFLESFKTNAF